MQTARPYLRVIKQPDPITQAIEVRELNERDSEFALIHDFGMTDFAPTQPSALEELLPAPETRIEARERFARTLARPQRGAVRLGFINGVLVLGLLSILAVAQQLDDQAAEVAVLNEPAHAARAAAREARLERAARAVCAAEVGPGSLPQWTQQGSLVCLEPLSLPIAMGDPS